MSDTDLILKNISRYISLTEDEAIQFVALLKPTTLKKKQLLLKEGQICTATAFVNSGCLRAFYIDHNGFEHILQFAPQDWWIADMYSLISREPGFLNIDAIENSEIFLLEKKQQENLFREIPKFERFFRILAEKSLVSSRQRVIDNMSLTAKQRYLNFCQSYPTLIYTLPQKQVASYIGVTPEFLSKLRKELSKNNKIKSVD